eukprot:TRINITY_DN7663_c0_g1_i1.p1 TRINITY_DN7663_c0_g1~~TRINITY_DN7663_c0_g1_i1.p1  ORF type:complete len:292 (-),score=30.13 TRINITY_DN7663_c0_g1_i1:21-896(-)
MLHRIGHKFSNQMASKRMFLIEPPTKPKLLPAIFFAASCSAGIWLAALELTTSYPRKSRRRTRQSTVSLFNNPTKWLQQMTDPAMWSESDVTLGGITLINLSVMMFSRVNAGAFYKHFGHNIFSGRLYTMLTSCFGHANSTHFLFNTVALWSFGKPLHDKIGRENFLAFYLSSALGASTCSHIFNYITKRNTYSIGASGAIYSIFALYYLHAPELSVLLFFLIPLNLGVAFQSAVLFDLIGLTGIFKRVLLLDHAAHLGGAATGIGINSLLPYINQYKYKKFRKKVLDTIK